MLYLVRGKSVTDVHKVFVSFYHDEDQEYKDKFERMCKDVIVSKSIQPGDIYTDTNTERVMQRIRDEYLKDSTVTVVLIGQHTWQRKYVDWEIYSSLRLTPTTLRSGLLGILLPTRQDYNQKHYEKCTVPPRLYYNNLKNNNAEPYAIVYNWTNEPSKIQNWIDRAFSVRYSYTPNLSFDRYGRNHTTSSWCNGIR